MIEVFFTVEGIMRLHDDGTECDYMDEDGNIDYADWVSDNISIDASGEWDVVGVEVYE